MVIKLETPWYHLVTIWGDLFTIDFYCESGPFVIQNCYTSFVNSDLSSNDVIAMDHLDASCEIDHTDWLVDKTTKVRHDIKNYSPVQLICSL